MMIITIIVKVNKLLKFNSKYYTSNIQTVYYLLRTLPNCPDVFIIAGIYCCMDRNINNVDRTCGPIQLFLPRNFQEEDLQPRGTESIIIPSHNKVVEGI